MNNKDRERLRWLANHQLEIANSPKNLERVELWKRHNMYKGERPPIHIEVGSFAHEAINPQLQCEDEQARWIEYKLINNFVNMELFDENGKVLESSATFLKQVIGAYAAWMEKNLGN